MIGNDVIDLALASKVVETNWFYKRFSQMMSNFWLKTVLILNFNLEFMEQKGSRIQNF
jgi:hypothetical protein